MAGVLSESTSKIHAQFVLFRHSSQSPVLYFCFCFASACLVRASRPHTALLDLPIVLGTCLNDYRGMDRSDSTSSNGSARARHNSALESGQFAYQRALLERTSSRSGTLSRTGSQSARNTILSTPTGTNGQSSPSATPNATRKWTPTHRVGGSLDINAVRGKWEERARTAEGTSDPRPLSDRARSDGPTSSPTRPSYDTPTRARTTDRLAFPQASPARLDLGQYEYSPSPPSKRHTMPAPIIASPLSPNTTGITVENENIDSPTSNSFSTPTPQRIHLPVSTPFQSSSIAAVRNLGTYAQTSDSPSYSPSARLRRSNTLESINNNSTGSSVSSENSARSFGTSQTSVPSSPDASTVSVRRRPTSLYGSDRDTVIPSPERPSRRPLSSSGMARTSSSPDKRPGSTSVPPSPSSASSSNPMFPTQYRSSFMAKKRGLDQLGTGQSVRRLERIASGDAPEDWPGTIVPNDEPPPPSPERLSRRETRPYRTREWGQPSPERRTPLPQVAPEPRVEPKPELVIPSVMNADDVVGIPRRKRLLRDTIPSNSPLPSSRLTRGLWADVQRHLIQAYEYLCHVGEAKEWIEGCLREELGFDVVELEERLRNGVILAKLVRVFQGEAAVRKIYDVRRCEVP